ncbi:MAG: hypothetical protein U5J62_05220 [Desulfurivibrio sp.]|nr:hypothetical protein [Desulfurivibrio sp.]
MLLELQIEKGLTLLLVTHDLGLARKIADRLAVMEAGRLVESGPAARVLSRPLASMPGCYQPAPSACPIAAVLADRRI